MPSPRLSTMIGIVAAGAPASDPAATASASSKAGATTAQVVSVDRGGATVTLLVNGTQAQGRPTGDTPFVAGDLVAIVPTRDGAGYVVLGWA